MARSFQVVTDSPASVEQVHSAFSNEDYWLARFEAFGGSNRLDSLTVDFDGTVVVITTQDLRGERLPAVLAKIFPADLTIRRSETWTPIGGRRISGEVSISAAAARASGRASASLAPRESGSELRFTGTVEVRIPLVAGRIESYLGAQLSDHIPEIQRFTSAWITERCGR